VGALYTCLGASDDRNLPSQDPANTVSLGRMWKQFCMVNGGDRRSRKIPKKQVRRQDIDG
jgi:hypothetical protein